MHELVSVLSMFSPKHNYCIISHFNELGRRVFNTFKNMLPALDFHENLSTYFKHVWTVFILKWYLDKNRKMVKLKSKFDRIQNMQVKQGYGDTKMIASTLS